MTSILRITLFLIALSVPHILLAQGYTLISPLGGLDSVGTDDTDSANTYLQILFNIFMAVAATLAVIRLMVCGIQYMTSEAVSSKGQAKTCLWYVLGGLLLILLSYIVLETINQNLVGRNFDSFFTRVGNVVPQSGLNVPNVGAGGNGPPSPGGGGQTQPLTGQWCIMVAKNCPGAQAVPVCSANRVGCEEDRDALLNIPRYENLSQCLWDSARGGYAFTGLDLCTGNPVSGFTSGGNRQACLQLRAPYIGPRYYNLPSGGGCVQRP